jgi:hypothetical protein
MIARAMRSLEPLTQLGNLRHMNPAELRQVLRTMNEGQGVQISGDGEVSPNKTSEAATPALNESARNN